MSFVQTLRCSYEKIEGQVDKWRYRCEVPLNKDTQREREREREATAAVELLRVHITHTKSICAEVAPIAFWVVSASTKFSTTRCSCPHHQLLELTVALAVGPLAWAMPAEVVCVVWRFSLSTCCCCNSAVLWRLACSIRKAFDQVNTSNQCLFSEKQTSSPWGLLWFGSDSQKINWRSQEVLNLDQSEPNFDFDFFRF